jgi:hypothetical protein
MSAKMGRPKNPPKFREVLQELIPIKEIFHEDEIDMYDGLVSVYLADFDESNLTANDMDDILSIAMNRVLEVRLLKDSKDNVMDMTAVSASIEKLRKQTEKLKENLANRRKDRIDPRKHTDFSIVNIAVAYDTERKQEQLLKAERLRKEESEALKSELLIGNRNDEDATIIEEE